MTHDPNRPPHWDVSNIYPSLDSPEYQADFAQMNNSLDQLFVYLDENQIQKSPQGATEHDSQKIAAILDDLVQAQNELYTLASTLRAYISSFVSTDSYNKEAQRAMSIFQQNSVRLQQAATRIQGWVGSLGELLPAALSFEGTAQEHTFFLEETAEQSQYMMSQAEEDLAAELALSGAFAWTKLQGTVTSQLSVDFELGGEIKKMPAPALINLRNHPDEATRRRAYEAEMQAWESVKEPLAAALNGVKGTVNTLDRRRGRTDPRSSDRIRGRRRTCDDHLASRLRKATASGLRGGDTTLLQASGTHHYLSFSVSSKDQCGKRRW